MIWHIYCGQCCLMGDGAIHLLSSWEVLFGLRKVICKSPEDDRSIPLTLPRVNVPNHVSSHQLKNEGWPSTGNEPLGSETSKLLHQTGECVLSLLLLMETLHLRNPWYGILTKRGNPLIHPTISEFWPQKLKILNFMKYYLFNVNRTVFPLLKLHASVMC